MANLPFSRRQRQRRAAADRDDADETSFGVGEARAIGRDGAERIAIADDAELMRGGDVAKVAADRPTGDGAGAVAQSASRRRPPRSAPISTTARFMSALYGIQLAGRPGYGKVNHATGSGRSCRAGTALPARQPVLAGRQRGRATQSARSARTGETQTPRLRRRASRAHRPYENASAGRSSCCPRSRVSR